MHVGVLVWPFLISYVRVFDVFEVAHGRGDPLPQLLGPFERARYRCVVHMHGQVTLLFLLVHVAIVEQFGRV